MRLAYTASARREVHEITQFYARQDRRVAVSFVEELDRSLALLLDNPRLGHPVSHRSRRLSLRRHPYTLYYSLEESQDLILVTVVCHQKRDPGYARDRIWEPIAAYSVSGAVA